MTKDEASEKFFGVNHDIKYLAEWISTFVLDQKDGNLQISVGESYGGIRMD